MIIIGLGANLDSPQFGLPRTTCEAALARLGVADVRIISRSRWFESKPVPTSSQPWYVNGVASIATDLEPRPLLDLLHRTEADMGRVRGAPDESRIIDLDLLAYDSVVLDGSDGLILPHPRMCERAFVLLPLREIAPGWQHPVTGHDIEAMIADLDPEQVARPLPD